MLLVRHAWHFLWDCLHDSMMLVLAASGFHLVGWRRPRQPPHVRRGNDDLMQKYLFDIIGLPCEVEALMKQRGFESCGLRKSTCATHKRRPCTGVLHVRFGSAEPMRTGVAGVKPIKQSAKPQPNHMRLNFHVLRSPKRKSYA